MTNGNVVVPPDVSVEPLVEALTGVFTLSNEASAFGFDPWPTTTSTGVVAVLSELAGAPVTPLAVTGAVTLTSGPVSVEGIDEPEA